MAKQLNTVIFDLAVRVETEGAAFYSALEAKSADPTVRKIFHLLADQEAEHKAVFLRLYARSDPAKGYDAGLESFLAGLQAGADKIIFDMTAWSTGENLRPIDVIEKAMQSEQETIEFYRTLKTRFTSQISIFIERIINEERKHVNKLMEAGQILRAQPGAGK